MAGAVLALFAFCVLLLFLTRDYQQGLYGGGGAVTALVTAAVGLVVARRQPGNPIGWLLLSWALLVPVVGVALLYSVLDYRIHRGDLPAGPVAVAAEAVAFLVAAASGLAVLLFPDGSLPSRRWRGAAWAFLACCALFTVHQFVYQADAAAARPLHVDWTGAPLAGRAPAGAAASLARAGPAAGWLVLALWLLFVARQAVSYRHSAGRRRQQLKWLLSGAVCCVVATAVTIFWGEQSSGVAQAIRAAADLGAAALPVGIGIGILRYRLYEIDRVISRTLAYAIVTGSLIGLYACLVLLATVVLPPSSPVAVAARRSWWRRCSARCGSGCSGLWTGGSTGPATTPTGWWRSSRPGLRTRWTWTRSKATWPGWSSRPWNRRTPQSGFAPLNDHDHEGPGRGSYGVVMTRHGRPVSALKALSLTA